MDIKEIKGKQTSITDVARRAGVSVGTVSHALNSVGYVKAETRERVMKAVRELNYVPNRAGRILKTRQTQLVMLAIPDTSNEIYFGMIESVQRVLKEHGYSLLLYYTNAMEKEEIRALKLLQECMIDGLILVHFNYTKALMDEIRRCNGPIVLLGMCNHKWAGKGFFFDTVSIDISLGIYNAVQHLIRAGIARSVISAVEEMLKSTISGSRPINARWKRLTLPIMLLMRTGTTGRRRGGYVSTRKLLMQKDRPTAICASNDLQGVGCWEAARDMGLRIPRDLALVGTDNINVMRVLGISSLKMQEDQMGETAASMLIGHLEGGATDFQDQYFRPELVVRDSSLYFESQG